VGENPKKRTDSAVHARGHILTKATQIMTAIGFLALAAMQFVITVCAAGLGQFDNDDTEHGDFTCNVCFEKCSEAPVNYFSVSLSLFVF